MNIGYACLTVGVEGTQLKTCRQSHADEEKLKEIILFNLNSLNKMLDYSIQNGIQLLRISSDIIPFGSHPVNTLKWWELFAGELKLLGKKAVEHQLRLSMHPGQYTVINSLHQDVVERSVKDLAYHTRFLDALGSDTSHKIILHIGGAYGNKQQALNRFSENYQKLDHAIKDRLVIENDDKIFNIHDVLEIGRQNDIPVVYDNLHNLINPYDDRSDADWIRLAGRTWKSKDGRQKIHYAQQEPGKNPGAHSQTIDLEAFLSFARKLSESGLEPDIMLEVKDKNLSAVKCLNGLHRQPFSRLESEWARYKYSVLEHSPKRYQEIRKLLKDKAAYPVEAFYRLIDASLSEPVTPGHAVNAAQHVWGYFKEQADGRTKTRVEREIEKIGGGAPTAALKRLLWRLAHDHNQMYLLNSLYFRDLF